ncbi:MAG TPA: acetylglutamate kinase [Thermoanaerobaculia bacterium]|nr:acetylglutamate kinase [Thermoanaerobaculia bacterium]
MNRTGSHSVEIAALRHAVPYLALFRGATFVVKLGGSAVADPRAVASVVEQVATLHHLGIRVVLVHGGGPQATALAGRLGHEVRQVAGRRVTDAETLSIVTLALNGEVATRLLAACRAASLPAVAVSGVAAGLVEARRRPPVAVAGEAAPVDYGFVGDISATDPRLLLHLLDGGYVPLVSPLAADAGGQVLNLNADGVAASLAVALRSEKLLFVIEPAGLLDDPRDPGSLVSYVDRAGLERRIEAGSIAGGMLPKAAAIRAALDGGVPRAHLISWRSPDSLLWEVFSNEGAGTLVVADLAALSAEERATTTPVPAPGGSDR